MNDSIKRAVMVIMNTVSTVCITGLVLVLNHIFCAKGQISGSGLSESSIVFYKETVAKLLYDLS